MVAVLLLAGGALGEVIEGALREQEENLVKAETLSQAEQLLRDHEFAWMVSAGFREIVPQRLLEDVGKTCNVHTSFLPWGRGANPNVWAIVEGEPAGVTVHEMTAAVDAGAVYVQEEVPTTFGDTGKSLYEKLLRAAGELFERSWPEIRDGQLRPRPQETGGSYHRSTELNALKSIDPDETLTWRRALNILRALTFPPHENLVIEEDGCRYHVELELREIQ